MIEKLILALCLCVPAFGQGILGPILQGAPAGGGSQSIKFHTNGTCSAGGGASCSISISQASVSGSSILVFWRSTTNGTTTTCSDNINGSTYTTSTLTGQSQLSVCYKANATAGVTSVTLAGGAAFATYSAVYVEIGGVTTFDVASTAWTATSGSPFTTASITTTGTDAIVGLMQSSPNTATCVAGSGYTQQEQLVDATNSVSYCLETQLNVGSGSNTASFTQTGGTGATQQVAAFAFK